MTEKMQGEAFIVFWKKDYIDLEIDNESLLWSVYNRLRSWGLEVTMDGHSLQVKRRG